MKAEFIPYELAVKLIYELEFKEKCLATIDQIGYLHIKGTKSSPRGAMVYDIVDCPTFSQTFRWFREKHGYHIDLFVDDDKTFGFCITYFTYTARVDNPIQRGFNTYEEAELHCLEKLIEIAEQK
jgi:hypothetical protein